MGDLAKITADEIAQSGDQNLSAAERAEIAKFESEIHDAPLAERIATAADAVLDKFKGRVLAPFVKSKQPAAPFTPPSMFDAGDLTYKDSNTDFQNEYSNVAVVSFGSAKSFSKKGRPFDANTKWLGTEDLRVWRALLAELAVHPKMEPVTSGATAERRDETLHTLLLELRDFYKVRVEGWAAESQTEFVRLMSRVALEHGRCTRERTGIAIQRAWTAPWMHPELRARRTDRGDIHPADPDWSHPKPINPAALANIVASADADKWIFRGEMVATIERELTAEKEESERETRANAAALAARNRIVRITPAKENLIATRLGPERNFFTFAWPFEIGNGLFMHIGGPIFASIENPNAECDVAAHEIEGSARNRQPGLQVFDALITHARSLPNAQDPIVESSCVTNEAGIFVMRSRVAAFHKIVDRVMPALAVEIGDGHGWLLASLVQAGVRGLMLHPLSVASNIEGAKKRMSKRAQGMIDARRLAAMGFDALRGGAAAWCPPGFLLEKKDDAK